MAEVDAGGARRLGAEMVIECRPEPFRISSSHQRWTEFAVVGKCPDLIPSVDGGPQVVPKCGHCASAIGRGKRLLRHGVPCPRTGPGNHRLPIAALFRHRFFSGCAALDGRGLAAPCASFVLLCRLPPTSIPPFGLARGLAGIAAGPPNEALRSLRSGSACVDRPERTGGKRRT